MINILHFSLLAILAAAGAAPTSDSELVPIIHQGEAQSQVIQSGNDALDQSIMSGDAAVNVSIDDKLNTLIQAGLPKSILLLQYIVYRTISIHYC
jgi:hypothetical protein